MNKNKIINLLIKEQFAVVNDLEKTIKVYKNASDIDEEDTIDPEDLSHQTEAKEMQLRLEEKLKREERVVNSLITYKDMEIASIGKGALIETDKMYIFIGAVTHSTEYEGKKLVGVSEKAPIVSSLMNQKVGSTITIGKEKHTIKAIA